MEKIFSRALILIAVTIYTMLTACVDQKQEGSYTYKITGFDEGMEGYVVKTTIRDLKTFKYETKEVAKISKGEFVINDTISFPRPAFWSIYDGEKMKKKGELILEAGSYTGNYIDQKIYIDNSVFNQAIYYGLNEDGKFKKASVASDEFMSSLDFDNVSQDQEDKIKRLLSEQNEARINYYESVYNQTEDLNLKLMACLVGRLYLEENDTYLLNLKDRADGHILITQMERAIENRKQADAMQASVAVGKSIKPFSAKNLSGQDYDLSQILKENKYVLVEFWASWCGPCRAEIPHMKKAYENFSNKGFEIVSFSLDHKRKNWEKASNDEQLPWLNISDLLAYDSPVTKMYGIRGIPANFLVDSQGTIVALDLRQDRLDKKLEELLN